MDPATVFLLSIIGALSLWLVGTAVPLVTTSILRVATALPVGPGVAAVVISAVLVSGVGITWAGVGTPASRMVEMASTTAKTSTNALPLFHRPMASAGDTYTVVRGDSLWRIARTVFTESGSLHDGSMTSDLWRAIYAANREVIGTNPNLIHPGQVLQIPGR